jgi:hypothetical protein
LNGAWSKIERDKSKHKNRHGDGSESRWWTMDAAARLGYEYEWSAVTTPIAYYKT